MPDTLRRAERDGLIARDFEGERIETATFYEPTDLGGSLEAPLAAIAEWADRVRQAVEAAGDRLGGTSGRGDTSRYVVSR